MRRLTTQLRIILVTAMRITVRWRLARREKQSPLSKYERPYLARDCDLPISSPQCEDCYHIVNKTNSKTCHAFPDGIPQEIFAGRLRHDIPLPGDHGIQYVHWHAIVGPRPSDLEHARLGMRIEQFVREGKLPARAVTWRSPDWSD